MTTTKKVWLQLGTTCTYMGTGTGTDMIWHHDNF